MLERDNTNRSITSVPSVTRSVCETLGLHKSVSITNSKLPAREQVHQSLKGHILKSPQLCHVRSAVVVT